MDTYQPRSDLSYWNLDALELWARHKVDGILEKKNVSARINDVSRMAVIKLDAEGDNHILWLKPSARTIERLSLKSMEITRHHAWAAQELFIDLTMDQSVDAVVKENWLYALVRSNQKYYIRRYRVIANALLPYPEILIDSQDLLPGSRLKVGTSRRGTTRAYLSIPGKNQFASIDLASKKTESLTVQMPENYGALSSEIDFCIDTWKDTLVVADSVHHCVVEIDCKSGKAQVICGTGSPGNAPEQTVAEKAQLNSPSSVAIYRPNEVVPDKHLTDPSRVFLTMDPDRIRPRTILVADSGNLRIKKIVELPFDVSYLLGVQDESFIYTLIGSGSESGAKFPRVTPQHKADLRSYPIPKPSKLLTTRSGELIVYFRAEQTFLVLKPASALEMKAREGASKDMDTTNP